MLNPKKINVFPEEENILGTRNVMGSWRDQDGEAVSNSYETLTLGKLKLNSC